MGEAEMGNAWVKLDSIRSQVIIEQAHPEAKDRSTKYFTCHYRVKGTSEPQSVTRCPSDCLEPGDLGILILSRVSMDTEWEDVQMNPDLRRRSDEVATRLTHLRDSL